MFVYEIEWMEYISMWLKKSERVVLDVSVLTV